MSLSNETTTDAEKDSAASAVSGTGAKSGVGFVPPELSAKCRELVESYHAMYGYAGLPDMLWLSDARDIIVRRSDLMQTFKRASKSRAAKSANDLFVAIATVVVSLEILARDSAGWGKRFPAAKQAAEKSLRDGTARQQRAWLMDLYLHPPLKVRRDFANALARSVTDAPAAAGN